MKKFIITTLLIFSAVIAFSQTSKVVKTSGSYEFISKDKKPIDIGKLNNGDHPFISAEGNKLVLTVKDKKVIGEKLYKLSGAEVKLLPSDPATIAKFPQLCNVCVVVSFPTGGSFQVCHLALCNDVDNLNKMNKSLSY